MNRCSFLEIFNARVGNQRIHWPRALGYHGIGKMNENGQKLLEFCNDLAITKTFFVLKDQHKISWCHHRSKHWHRTDFILARRIDLNCVRLTPNLLSAHCYMDHTLVVSKLSVKAKQKHHTKPAPKSKTNVNMCKHY